MSEHVVDIGKHGLSAGDHNIIRSQILDRHGKVVGRADFDCVATEIGAILGGLCHGVITLAGGQLTDEFAWDRSGSSRYQAITGGTQQYEGARGQAIVDTSGSDSRELFVVELMR